ncbi:calcium-activated chloride channel regulator 1-like [Silurus meridionalis]|uniref:calcium-activated chloride channel regulator 1-like n=1 Tax=Silurus meridionalis TaxID=175797 RepID=UPI001EECBFB0|nr:calcium-activated chloride channel regulator 1-like [Silurus meridionalis]
MVKMLAVVVLFLFALKSATTIRLDGNGYTDILVVINPAVPENEELLNQIKKMITSGSEYLFEALDNKVFFKEVKILVPPTWTSGKYEKATTETYKKGKIRIDESSLQYGNEPYTHQPEGCGREGEYIHLTPDFLLNNHISKPYGPRERVFVHEWAHLRWGVFDEYNKKEKYYISANRFRPTSCTNNLSGQWKKILNQSTSVPCELDASGALTPDCEFLPDAMQTTKSSIMFMPSIHSVKAFCREEEHNLEAPNEQNKQCGKATRTVIFEDSVDKDALHNLKPLPSDPPPPTFKVIQRGPRVVCLILDVSGSMTGGRLSLLQKAAGIFLNQIINEQEYVALVTFSSNAQILTHLTKIEGQATRDKLISKLPTIAAGQTFICKGFRKGFEALRMNDGETLGKEIIFLTDGEATDNVLDCLQESVKSGAIIHTVALGPNADNTLRTMAVQTEGMFHIASEILSSNDLVDAFASKITWDGNPCKQPVQLESTGKRVEDWFNGTVSIDRTVGNRTTFTLLYERSAPTVYIQSPSGLVYDQRHTTNNANTITFTVPGTAEVGEWKYSFFNNETSAQEASLLVMSWAVSEDIPPITVTIRMNQQTSDGTKPMVVLAAVRQNYNPVLGASVWVHLESDTRNSSKFQLLDNGAGCDVFRDDGIYSRYFTELRCGKYSLKVKVEYQHGADQFSFYRHSGALYVPGYVVDGNVELNPPQPAVNVQSVNVGRFTRTGTGESVVVETNAVSNFPPNKITDLSAEIQEDTVLLSWTSPGEDYDHGTAQSYDIRWSEDLKILRNNFSSCNPVNTSSLQPQESGSAEQYSFKADIEIENDATIFCAIQSMDKDSAKSEVSNIVRVSWAKHVSGDRPSAISNPGLNLNAIILSVCVVAIVVCVIIVVTRALKKRTHSFNII